MKKAAAILLFVCALSLPGDEPRRKWEYMIVGGCDFEIAYCYVGGGAHPKFTPLSEIGSDGWELVSAFPNGTMIFKRSK